MMSGIFFSFRLISIVYYLLQLFRDSYIRNRKIKSCIIICLAVLLKKILLT